MNAPARYLGLIPLDSLEKLSHGVLSSVGLKAVNDGHAVTVTRLLLRHSSNIDSDLTLILLRFAPSRLTSRNPVTHHSE